MYDAHIRFHGIMQDVLCFLQYTNPGFLGESCSPRQHCSGICLSTTIFCCHSDEGGILAETSSPRYIPEEMTPWRGFLGELRNVNRRQNCSGIALSTTIFCCHSDQGGILSQILLPRHIPEEMMPWRGFLGGLRNVNRRQQCRHFPHYCGGRK